MQKIPLVCLRLCDSEKEKERECEKNEEKNMQLRQ